MTYLLESLLEWSLKLTLITLALIVLFILGTVFTFAILLIVSLCLAPFI